MNALLLMAAVLLPGQTSLADLKSLDSEEGRFRVMLPGTPGETRRDSVETPYGKAERSVFMVETSDREVYGVVLMDYPDGADLDPDTVLDGYRDSQVSAVKGKLLESKAVANARAPGRAYEYEFAIAGGTKLIGRSRVYLVKSRLFQVSVIGTKEVARGDVATKILNSFEMTEVQRAVTFGKTKASKRKRPKIDTPAAYKSVREDAEFVAKIDKIRAAQETSLKKLKEKIEETKLTKAERETLWVEERAALDRAIWEAYHLFDPQTEFKAKAEYLDKKQAEYRDDLIKKYRITKEVLALVRDEGIVEKWDVQRYPSCDTRAIAKTLKIEVRGIQDEEVYHRPACLVLTKDLEKPDAKEVRMTLYKALTTPDVKPCPVCLP